MKNFLFKTIILFACILLTGEDSFSIEILPDQMTQSLNAETATSAYLNQLSDIQKEKSDDYFEGGYWIMLWQFILEIVVALVFLSLGLGKWIRNISQKFKGTHLQNLIYTLLYLLFAYAILFPMNVYTGFIREHQYELSNMNFLQWFKESLTELAILLLFGSMLIMLLYLTMRKLMNYWWIIGSFIVFIFMVISLFISPVLITPLFNDYKPLDEGIVRDEVLRLAKANGVPATEIYQYDASRQTSRISANVNGIGKTIRISLNDNLLNQCSLSEIKTVMAHELGHYVLNHIWKLLIYISILVFAGFALLDMLMKEAVKRYGERWSIKEVSDISSLPLLILIFSFMVFVGTPLLNNIIRSTETEADIFGLNAAREPDGFASVAIKLAKYRKINPGEFEECVFFDHPSGKSRISMAMQWKFSHLNQLFRDTACFAEAFIPDIVHQFPQVRDVAFSPDGKELYITAQSVQSDLMNIIMLKKQGTLWGNPEMAGFSGKYNDLEPAFSPDGLRLYFVSNRPLSADSDMVKDYDIWYVERTDTGGYWSDPVNVGPKVNTSDNEFYPSIAASKNLYFTTDGAISTGRDDIFLSKWENGAYQKPISAGDSVNTPGYEFNSFIAPDESFIIYTAYERPGGYGKGDLYISYRKNNESWTTPLNLGGNINTLQMEYCPWVDMKTGTLYFTSMRSRIMKPGKTRTIDELILDLNAYENGQSRLYKADINYYIQQKN